MGLCVYRILQLFHYLGMQSVVAELKHAGQPGEEATVKQPLPW